MNTRPGIRDISDAVSACQKCALCTTRTNAVPGEGRHNAEIMFVGEAPGRSEDVHGRPFVGAAGTKLSTALDGAGLSRDDVYITNVVKCRPPENRVPTASERRTCMPYLQEEISAINPRIICILGNTAFGSILGGSEITKHRGTTAEMDGRLYYITIHPAAVIYNQSMIKTLNDDIKNLASMVRRLRNGEKITPDAIYEFSNA